MKSLELNTLTLISISHETDMSCWHWCNRF